MAERRMFAKTIIDSDCFLDMPLSAQALYFHLAMRADDEGFINNPKKIQRMVSGTDDDLKLLIAKRFIIPFESGIVAVRHWRVHNYIQKDRFKPTFCREEKALVCLNANNVYEECIQPGTTALPQVRQGEERQDKARQAQLPGLAVCVREYEENIGAVGAYVGDCIRGYLEEGMEPALVTEAIREAAARNARSWKYIDSILRRCRQEGIATAEAFLAAGKQRARKETAAEQMQRCLEELERGEW